MALLAGPLAAQARLAAPSLLLHANQSLSVQWQPEAGASHSASYRLLLTVTRPGADSMHVTKLAPAGSHKLYWGGMPDQARCCWRVAAISSSTPDEERYSPETCVNSAGCEAAAPSDEGGTYAFVGSVVGAALTVFVLAMGVRLGLLSVSFSPPPIPLPAMPGSSRSRRGTGRSCYSHLTTDEASIELGQRGVRRGGAGGGIGGGGAGPGGSGGALGALLEPQPVLDATAFERRWGACADRYCVFGARLASADGSPSPDETEEALTRAGLVCIAAGAVGSLHKSYFAGKLRNSGEWFMLELVLFWDEGSVQATFRADSAAVLPQLADYFAALLSRMFGAQLATLPVE